MKNNKGFTLIEVLATIIILSIVSVISIPKIFDYISSSRETIYIQDAKKMIAQAQYVMGASSTSIEKPGPGEVIIFTLNYLAGNDFRNAPNGGKYMFSNSFVLVTYSNNKYYYAAMLVENVSNKDYSGIKLSSEEAINDGKRTYLISGFDSDSIYYPTRSGENYNGVLMTSSDIKSHLGHLDVWKDLGDNSIVRIYHDKTAEELSPGR